MLTRTMVGGTLTSRTGGSVSLITRHTQLSPISRSFRSCCIKRQSLVGFNVSHPQSLSVYTSTLSIPVRWSRALSTSVSRPSPHVDKATSMEEVLEARKADFRDCFIPLTRRSVIQRLMERDKFLTEDEKKVFEKFALTLDAALATKLDGDLTALKALFDSINPDKDTIESRKYNRRERLDNEFWLLQKLSRVLERANFHELPKSVVDGAVGEHSVGGVQVSALPEQYDVIRYWALGRATRRSPAGGASWYKSLSVVRQKYYKRVIVAVRLKTDDRLMIKAFKEVPVDQLQHLLPAGTIRMSTFDQYSLIAAGAFTLGSVCAKLLSNWFSFPVTWPLLLASASTAGAAFVWTSYKNKQQHHLVELSKTLYFKNIINNRGLLALITSKARDEVFKEALLAYTFLLVASRSPSGKDKGSLSTSLLEHNVSDWLDVVTSLDIHFNSSESIRLIDSLGLLIKHDGGVSGETKDLYSVLPIEAALRHLPPTAARVPGSGIDEYDLVEGFEVERSIMEEHEEDYTLADKIRKRLGWH